MLKANALVIPRTSISTQLFNPLSTISQVKTLHNEKRITLTQLNQHKKRHFIPMSSRKGKKCDPCEDNDILFSSKNTQPSQLDRREATFAMIGNLWSRGILPTAAMSTLLSYPMRSDQAAHAIYGSDANIQLPNVMDSMNDRINKQCIVESLGNRECLVYMDPENQLYKGADSDLLLLRLEKSTMALATIPGLVGKKQWSNIQGVITGPMGTLFATMNELGNLSEHPDEIADIAKKVKMDLFAISSATERRQTDIILKHHQSATDNLIAFVSTL